MPGARENGKRKDPESPYLELTQVSLGEKPKARRRNAVEGIRQNGPVSSVEGVPALRKSWSQ